MFCLSESACWPLFVLPGRFYKVFNFHFYVITFCRMCPAKLERHIAARFSPTACAASALTALEQLNSDSDSRRVRILGFQATECEPPVHSPNAATLFKTNFVLASPFEPCLLAERDAERRVGSASWGCPLVLEAACSAPTFSGRILSERLPASQSSTDRTEVCCFVIIKCAGAWPLDSARIQRTLPLSLC